MPLDNYEYKLGRITHKEEEYILENIGKKTIEEIGKELNRDVKTLQKILKRIAISDNSTIVASARQLKDKPYWKELERQFSPLELELFVDHWYNIISQFKHDTFYTEELQIVEVIKLDILSNRILTDQHQVRLDIEQTEKEINDEKRRDGQSDSSKATIMMLETKLTQLSISLNQYMSDYESMLKHKKDMMKEIKGSRAERIKQIESSRESFTGWFRNFIINPDQRKEIGEWVEKMRIATDYEVVRLSEYHKYENGEYDLPLLNAETVKLIEEHKDESSRDNDETNSIS